MLCFYFMAFFFLALFYSCSTNKHCTWYHALPHFKEKICLTERKNVVWPCCCFDLLNLKKIIIMPAMCHLLAQLI